MKKQMLRLTYDADGAGRQCGKAIIANDEKALHNISAKIDLGHEIVNEWVSRHGGKRISGGGDEGSFRLPEDAAKKVESLREKYYKSTGLTISVGIGKDLSQAGRSLLYAKATGKDKIVWYSLEVEEGIKRTTEKVKNGIASQEEMKLADAYLEKSELMLCNLHKKENHKKHLHQLHKHEEGFHQDVPTNDNECPYCADNEDNRTDDCAYCQDLDAEENADGTAGMHDCPACHEYDAANQETGGIEDCPYCNEEPLEVGGDMGVDPCPYCESEAVGQAEAGTPAEQGAEDHHQCNCPNCPVSDQTGLAVEDMAAERTDHCPQCEELYSQAVENEPDQTGQGDPNLQGHETAEEVLDLLDKEPGAPGATPAQAAKKIDNTEMPQGDQMEENTSVPENFGNAQKADVSDSDQDFQENTASDGDEPDMTGVLQSGLDDHASEQKKQQVLDMVGQTLAGFKANKQSLEATKEQNQPLYNSCIQMLKSMIELCKLLGLEPQMPQESGQNMSQSGQNMSQSGQNMSQSGQNMSQSGQSPKAAPSEGAAQDPKTQAR